MNLSFKQKRRIVKLYSRMLDDPDIHNLGRNEAKKLARLFVQLELSYDLC